MNESKKSNDVFNAELKKAYLLNDEREKLMQDLILGKVSKEKNLSEQFLLLDKMLTFEKELKNPDILYSLYEVIARVHLFCDNIDEAMQYAIAAMESNQHRFDQEGFKSAVKTVFEIAYCISAYHECLKLVKLNPEICDAKTKLEIESKLDNSINDEAFRQFVSSPSRPASLALLLKSENT